MQWRGQRGGVHHAGAAAGLDESHLVIPADFVFHANATVELDQVCADAEEYVLAIIDHFAGPGMFVGRGASTEIRTALEEGDAEAGVGERAGGGKAGEAATGDGYGELGGTFVHALVRH